MEKVPMTPEGHRALEEELKTLRSKGRPEVIQAIAEAREHGDLSENAEYHAARERQSFIEGRIVELEDIISRAQVIDSKGMSEDKVRFGAWVTLADEDTDEEKTYRIVGAHEADIKEGRLSLEAPMARAMIGKEVGDSIEVSTPSGSRAFEIVAVKYPES